MKIILKSTLVILLAGLSACSGDTAPDKSGKPSGQAVSTAITELHEVQISETLTGNLQAKRNARLHNQQAGVVSRLHAFPGDRVKQDELLAQLDDKLLAAQRDRALASLAQARLDLQRAETLAASKLISEDALARVRTAAALAEADAKLAQVQFDYSRITAPFSGVISERLVDEGDVLANQTHMFTLLDTQSLKVQVFVSENLLPQLKVNDVASIHTDATDTNSITGKITRVSPGLNPETRQGEIEISIHPAPKHLLPGQLCSVTLQGKKITSLMIPFDALRHDNLGAFVYRVSDNKVQRTAVKSGTQTEGFIEITEGLQAGDVVVTKGFTGLHDGKSIAIASNDNKT